VSSSTETVGSIYKRHGDSVVEITVTSAGQAGPRAGPAARNGRPAPGSSTHAGTRGLNQHVVDGAQSVSVKFANSRTYSATVVGADPSTDLAVIDSTHPHRCSALELGDSSAVEVGDGDRDRKPVRARPDRHDRHRQRLASSDHLANNFSIDNAIQTDAAINRQLGRPRCSHAAT
jgi:hypothetical protein